LTDAAVIGVDLGTQSAKAALFTLDGRALAQASIPLSLRRRTAQEVDQDPDEFYRATTATIASCLDQAGPRVRPADVVGLGVSGQMAGVVGVGNDGEAITPYDSWLDSRCSAQLDELRRAAGPRFTAVTGCPPMIAHAPKMLWWAHEHPDVYHRVSKFVVASAYVAMRLCGLAADDAYIDETHLHFTGLVDAARGEWSADLASALGLDPYRLPRIVAATDRIGGLSNQAAHDCGLPAGVPVSAGLGDTAAGALGAGVVEPGQLLDTCGTAAVLSISTAQFVADETGALLSMRGAVPGQWIWLAYLAAGDVLAWLPGVLGEPSLDVLTKEAEISAAGPSLVFLPHLSGRVLPAAPRARGAWVGLELDQSRGDLTRAVLESVAFEYAGYLERARELAPGLEAEEVRVIGGGSGNDFWNRVKASVLGLPYARLRGEHFSSWGAALTAAAAAGAVKDIRAAAAQASEVVATVMPNPQLQDLYAQRTANYRKVSAGLMQTFESLSV
jgi:xylulokinase